MLALAISAAETVQLVYTKAQVKIVLVFVQRLVLRFTPLSVLSHREVVLIALPVLFSRLLFLQVQAQVRVL